MVGANGLTEGAFEKKTETPHRVTFFRQPQIEVVVNRPAQQTERVL